ncbi:MATE family efflux transporter [Paraclostridium bifermentans]|nr:MATE family efflux transporter [Paraclostridium bifermentans]
MEDKKIRLLRDEKVSKAILKLSIPMVMGMMIQVLYNLVDTYFIGMLNDANQLAAANISLPVFMMLIGYCRNCRIRSIFIYIKMFRK